MAAFDQNSDTRKKSQSPTANCCPPTDQLIEFVAGQLDERTMVRLESHFEECPSCAELLVEIGNSADDDPFEQRLREAAANRDLAVNRLPHAATTRGAGSNRSTSYRGPDDGVREPAVAQQIRQEFAGCERYELQEFLGGGGMGLVFAANHRVMGRRVAVKAIDPVLLGRQDVAARFEREVRAVAALRHPNLVLAYDADAVGAIHFLVMELLEGEDLKRHVDRQGPLSFGAACRMVGTAARALGAAHERGIIHRDVKPRNLFLTKESQLKVLDFGLASLRILEPERSVWATQSGVLLGTLETMAPEQLDEPASVDARADVFGLGCTLYFMITGRSPFQRRSRRETLQALLNGDVASPARLDRGIPGPLAKYVLRMLASDAADRPSTMEEVAEGLDTWSDVEENLVASVDPVGAAAEGAVARRSEQLRRPKIRNTQATHWFRTRRRLLVGGLGAIGCVGTFAAWSSLNRGVSPTSVTSKPAARRRVLIAVPSENFWFPTFYFIRRALRRRPELHIEVASTGSRSAVANHEYPNGDPTAPTPHDITADTSLSEVDASDVDACIFVSAFPPEFLEALFASEEFSHVVRFVRHMDRQRKTLAAVAAGIAILAEAGCLEGREAAWSRFMPFHVQRRVDIDWRPDQPVCVSAMGNGPRIVTAASSDYSDEMVDAMLQTAPGSGEF